MPIPVAGLTPEKKKAYKALWEYIDTAERAMRWNRKLWVDNV